MRRKEKEIGKEEAAVLLENCLYGVLSTVDSGGRPYGVPLNYVYRNGNIYFHCALEGRKIDNIRDNPKVSFCVVASAAVVPSKFETEYECIVASGVAEEAQGSEWHDALTWLVEKYSPEYVEEGRRVVSRCGKETKIIKVRVDCVTGKRSQSDPGG